MKISFIVPGVARSNRSLNKVTCKGGKARQYTDRKDKAYNWYCEVRAEAYIALPKKKRTINSPSKTLSGPLKLNLIFFKKRPKGKKDTFNMTIPDLDNMEKIFTDALEGILFENDKQIVAKSSMKLYGDESCVYVELEELS